MKSHKKQEHFFNFTFYWKSGYEYQDWAIFDMKNSENISKDTKYAQLIQADYEIYKFYTNVLKIFTKF